MSDSENRKIILASKNLKIIVGILAAINFIIWFIWQVETSGNYASATGSAIGIILWGFAVVGIFQIFKKFRNQQSRYKIFLWFFIVGLVSGTTNLLNSFGANIGS